MIKHSIQMILATNHVLSAASIYNCNNWLGAWYRGYSIGLVLGVGLLFQRGYYQGWNCFQLIIAGP